MCSAATLLSAHLSTIVDSKASVLITGVAGFVGSAIAEKLCSFGIRVLGIDNLNDYYSIHLKRSRLQRLSANYGSGQNALFSFHELDICDHDKLVTLCKGEAPAYIFHMAAQAGVRYSLDNPWVYIESNVKGFLSILELVRKYNAGFVYASSSSVYGGNEVPFSETQSIQHPFSLYAATKCANEAMAASYVHSYGISAIGLRFFTVYGPWGRPDMAIYKFTDAIQKGEPIYIYDNGSVVRDFTYIDDIIQFITAAAAKLAAGEGDPSHEIYNAASGNPVSLAKIIESLEYIIGKKAILKPSDMHSGDMSRTQADMKLSNTNLGVKAPTNIDTGLEIFYQWYKKYHELT